MKVLLQRSVLGFYEVHDYVDPTDPIRIIGSWQTVMKLIVFSFLHLKRLNTFGQSFALHFIVEK